MDDISKLLTILNTINLDVLPRYKFYSVKKLLFSMCFLFGLYLDKKICEMLIACYKIILNKILLGFVDISSHKNKIKYTRITADIFYNSTYETDREVTVKVTENSIVINKNEYDYN